MSELIIREATDADGTRWDKFLRECDVRNHSVAWAWRSILQQAFGHQPQFLIAESAHDIVGALPLFSVKSFLFGQAFISVPYLNGGGVISSNPLVKTALLQKAIELSGGAKYLELRHREPEMEFSQLHQRSHKVSMVLSLQSDPEQMFRSFPAKLRSQIRRPEKSGARVEIADDDRLLDPFYRVFSEHMRELGTPVYPKELFAQVVRATGLRVKTFVVWYEGAPASCAMTIGWDRDVEILWASSLNRYNFFSPNMILYWEAIKAACLEGARSFDFGRCSRDSGTYRFKKQWGCEELPLHWYYHLRAGSIPDVNPQSAKFRLLVKCWQHLPLFLTNALGPFLTRSLP